MKLVADNSLSSEVLSTLDDAFNSIPGGSTIPHFTRTDKRQYCMDGQGATLQALRTAPEGVVMLGSPAKPLSHVEPEPNQCLLDDMIDCQLMQGWLIFYNKLK